MESARQDVALQVKSAVNFIEVSHAQLGPARELVEATTAVSESYLRQFAVGQKSWLDVMNAQREAHQARLFQITQRKNFLSGYYRLQVMRQAYAPLTAFASPMTELEQLRLDIPER
jgi:adhesin transport system outer membrane protein